MVLNEAKNYSTSSTESEYRSLASCASKVLWIKNLLQELHVSCATTPKILCDNVGVIYLPVNPVFHSRMKHIAIDYYFVRDHVARGSFSVSVISSKDQLAYALTKPLSSASFQALRSKIGISNGSTVLWGDVREISTEPFSKVKTCLQHQLVNNVNHLQILSQTVGTNDLYHFPCI